MLAVEEPVVRGEDDLRLVQLADRRQPVDDLRRPPRRRRAATRAAAGSSREPRRSSQRSISGRLRMPAGLSETSASLNEGGIGSGCDAKTIAVARRRRRRGLVRRDRPGRAARRCAARGRRPRGRTAAGRGRWRRIMLDGLPRRRRPSCSWPRRSRTSTSLPFSLNRVVEEAVRGGVGRAVPLAPARRDLGLARACRSRSGTCRGGRSGSPRAQPRRKRVRAGASLS